MLGSLNEKSSDNKQEVEPHKDGSIRKRLSASGVWRGTGNALRPAVLLSLSNSL